MSKDLEELAAEMQKMRPSQSSRAGGIDAAMAAFSSEFETKTEAAKTVAQENNLQTSQGLTEAAREASSSSLDFFVIYPVRRI